MGTLRFATRALIIGKYYLSAWFNSPSYTPPTYHPLKIYLAPTNEIHRMMIPGKELSRKYDPGIILNGGWDKETMDFEDSIYFKSFKRKFVDNYAWEETPLYHSAVQREGCNLWRGCQSTEEIKRQLVHYENIFNSMKEDGYLSQFKLQKRGVQDETLSPPAAGEIRINIGRKGELIFDDGRHRLAMAKLLDIETIPVIIIGRHQNWVLNDGEIEETPLKPLRESQFEDIIG